MLKPIRIFYLIIIIVLMFTISIACTSNETNNDGVIQSSSSQESSNEDLKLEEPGGEEASEVKETGMNANDENLSLTETIDESFEEVAQSVTNNVSNNIPSSSEEETNVMNSELVDSIVWQATHESGTIGEWEERGGFYRQGPTGNYRMVTPFAHTGVYSVALTIDTLVPTGSEEVAHAAYLFFTDQLPDDAYYYSIWYYLPEDVEPVWWWNIYQWKSTYDGNTDNSEPTFVVNIERWEGHGMRIYVSSHIDYVETNADIINYHQEIMSVPTLQWFQIEGYYKKALDNTGQVIIWQDGVEIINISGVRTALADNTLQWSVNSYTDEISPNPLTILVDDAAISKKRLGPDTKLPIK